MAEINAVVAHQGGVVLRHEVVDESFLPEGDVGLTVEYSSVNYRDGQLQRRSITKTVKYIDALPIHRAPAGMRQLEETLTPRQLEQIASDVRILDAQRVLSTIIAGDVTGRTRVDLAGGF